MSSRKTRELALQTSSKRVGVTNNYGRVTQSLVATFNCNAFRVA
jgi:hypothetical protein